MTTTATSQAAAESIKPHIKIMRRRAVDITGMRFGRLLALRPNGTVGRKVMWDCRCDCGALRTIRGTDLRAGVASCGCANNDATRAANTTHGRSDTKTYRVWRSMRQRCSESVSSESARRNYIGRGIRVCKRWESFEAFVEDMGMAPAGLTIDRKNNNLGYFKANCRWVDHKAQARNRRGNRLITAFGETKVLAEWAEDKRCSVTPDGIAARLERGWGVERAITSPKALGMAANEWAADK